MKVLAADIGGTYSRTAWWRENDSQVDEVCATYTGNLAVSCNPGGGTRLCGGLTVHLADWFDPATFQHHFTAKGRMAEVVRRMPVFLITGENTGLAGAVTTCTTFYRADE